MLIPQQSILLIGIEIFIVAVGIYASITTMDIGIYKKTDVTYKKQYFFSVVFNQLSVLPYLAAGIIILMGNEKGIYWLVPAILLSFIKSVVDAWVLLVEINR